MHAVILMTQVVLSRIGGFVRVVNVTLAKAFGAPEGHNHHARHINGGEQGCQRGDEPKRLTPRRARQTERSCAPRFPKDLVLGKESGKNRYARDGEPSSEHGRKRDGHVFPESTHASHVLLVMHAMDY